MGASSLRTFIVENILDQLGHVPAAIGQDASEIVTPDRRLRDAALAVLVLASADDELLTTSLATALLDFKDLQFAGY
ncbi:hypothetical protein [Paraburkholderia aspalathi]|uniref:hypothetical protein n=1 Tax=Paraburkholderia aspalathi TaxID=1324617 RepID=UPI0038B9E289